jgi:hypothetical protein
MRAAATSTVDNYVEFMSDMDDAKTKLECLANYDDRNKADSVIENGK